LVGKQAQVTAELKLVASAFTQLQERRHIADYDNAYSWTRTEALRQIESAERAFAAWRKIRKERIAQDFLLSLLVKNRD
jgi:hypothetical protein